MTRRPKWIARAEETIDDRTAPPAGERMYATGRAAHTAEREALRREQQDEVAESWFGTGFMTDAQLKGVVFGSILGGIVGALLFLPLGFIGWGGPALGWRVAIAPVCGGPGRPAPRARLPGGR